MTAKITLPTPPTDHYWKIGPDGIDDWEYGFFYPNGESRIMLRHRYKKRVLFWHEERDDIIMKMPFKSSDGKSLDKRAYAAAQAILDTLEARRVTKEMYGEYK